MSLWKRMRRVVFGDGGTSGGEEQGDDPMSGSTGAPSSPLAEDLAPAAVAPPPPAEAPPDSPEAELRAVAEGRAPFIDAAQVVELVDALCASGREVRAIALARRILARHPDATALALRLADVLSGRGDDDGARDALRPLLALPDPQPAAWMLAGEIAERSGAIDEALAYYERVLAYDLDWPRARERVARLRESHHRTALAGATLMTDGALARGRYRLERELGRGGAGTVFAARDVELDRRVALKVYHRRGRVDRERLRVEARTAASLEHPGVVRIFDLDEQLGAIAMEHVHGGSVRQRLRRGAVPIAQVERWARTALEALAYVHSRGFVHRDLKPSNFLLRDDDRVVLTDFGLALPAGGTPMFESPGGEGTLAYMPPEQRAGAAAEASADVYAFGASLREVLGQTSGEIPSGLLELARACLRESASERPTIGYLLERVHAP